MNRVSSTVVVAAIIILVGIGAILLTVLTALGNGVLGEGTAPFLTSLLGIIGTTVVSFLTLLRIEQTRRDIHNGIIKEQAKEAIVETANGEREWLKEMEQHHER